jgi:hypothetical protein
VGTNVARDASTGMRHRDWGNRGAEQGSGARETRGEGQRGRKCRSRRRTGIPEMIQRCLFGTRVVRAVRRLYPTATNAYSRLSCAIAWGASFSGR